MKRYTKNKYSEHIFKVFSLYLNWIMIAQHSWSQLLWGKIGITKSSLGLFILGHRHCADFVPEIEIIFGDGGLIALPIEFTVESFSMYIM